MENNTHGACTRVLSDQPMRAVRLLVELISELSLLCARFSAALWRKTVAKVSAAIRVVPSPSACHVSQPPYCMLSPVGTALSCTAVTSTASKKGLIDKELAYEVNGSVYFRVSKHGKYGTLACLDTSGMEVNGWKCFFLSLCIACIVR